ncbi:MAG TPA: cell division protein FtsH, partial [Actinophytocola sp.]|nr:cell division protein FtsH [Actinophytocola sp.]
PEPPGGNGAGPNGLPQPAPPPRPYPGTPPLYPPPPGQDPGGPRRSRVAGPPNYGAPPGWTPATTPQGYPHSQPWPSPRERQNPQGSGHPGQPDEDSARRERGSEWDSGG